MNSAIFITGTDTGVGKTVVAAAVALALKRKGLDVGAMKPAATGCRRRGGERISEDVEYLTGACGCEDERELVCPYMLREPLAPEIAAEREHARIDIRKITRAFKELSRRHEALIVEGAGGLFVPIKRNYFMLDLVEALCIPMVLVVRPGLGTINHTLLSCEAIRSRNTDLIGIVVNDYPKKPSLAERTNPEIIRRYSGCRMLGVMPKLPRVSVEKGSYDGLRQAAERHIDIDTIVKYLRRKVDR